LLVVVDLIKVYSVLKLVGLADHDHGDLVLSGDTAEHRRTHGGNESTVTENVRGGEEDLRDLADQEAHHRDKSVLALDSMFGQPLDHASSAVLRCAVNNNHSQLFAPVVSLIQEGLDRLRLVVAVSQDDLLALARKDLEALTNELILRVYNPFHYKLIDSDKQLLLQLIEIRSLIRQSADLVPHILEGILSSCIQPSASLKVGHDLVSDELEQLLMINRSLTRRREIANHFFNRKHTRQSYLVCAFKFLT